MNDLLQKRSRQAHRLLRVCLRPISTECIQRYVDGYEAGTLEHKDDRLCAIGTMSGMCYEEWTGPHPHVRESRHIENIFEGWPLWTNQRLAWDWNRPLASWRDGDGPRSRWIYSACLEALALRASEHTPRAPSTAPVGG